MLLTTNPSKAAGLDNLAGKFLREGASVLVTPVTEICNLSIRLSAFPDKCKIAKLKPLFKKGSKTEAKNYRPISLLPLISKIVEKVIYDQTQIFFRQKSSYIQISIRFSFKSLHKLVPFIFDQQNLNKF